MAALARLVSGGQTGVDRAALDAALDRDFPCGGHCPRGRRAEDGPIPARYPLVETAGRSYIERTRLNVVEADATLLLSLGAPDRGSRATLAIARDLGKPCLEVTLGPHPDPATVAAWLAAHGVRVLNVAGPRESNAPGVGQAARAFLDRLLDATA